VPLTVKRISDLLRDWKLHLDSNKFLLLLITDEELLSLFKDGIVNNIEYNFVSKGIKLTFENENTKKMYTIQQSFKGRQPTWNLVSSEECKSLLLPIYVSRQIKSQAALTLLNEFTHHNRISYVVKNKNKKSLFKKLKII
jgi:hypothetical protein